MTRTLPRRALPALAFAAVVALGACGSDSDSDSADEPAGPDLSSMSSTSATPSGDEPAAAGGDRVVIEGFAFSPTPLVVASGTTITVENKDRATHTLTADDGSFDTGNLAQNATGTITVTGSGEFTYHCDLHDQMTGVIRIQA